MYLNKNFRLYIRTFIIISHIFFAPCIGVCDLLNFLVVHNENLQCEYSECTTTPDSIWFQTKWATYYLHTYTAFIFIKGITKYEIENVCAYATKMAKYARKKRIFFKKKSRIRFKINIEQLTAIFIY